MKFIIVSHIDDCFGRSIRRWIMAYTDNILLIHGARRCSAKYQEARPALAKRWTVRLPVCSIGLTLWQRPRREAPLPCLGFLHPVRRPIQCITCKQRDREVEGPCHHWEFQISCPFKGVKQGLSTRSTTLAGQLPNVTRNELCLSIDLLISPTGNVLGTSELEDHRHGRTN